MKIKELNQNTKIENDQKLQKKYDDLKNLIVELNKREIPPGILQSINENVEQINTFAGSNKEWSKLLRKSATNILKLIEKELKLVPKNLYRNRWMVLGMSVFGVPMGAAFGVSLGNMSFLAIGIPIGMAIGIAVGVSMDKKAFDEGKQLDLESIY